MNKLTMYYLGREGQKRYPDIFLDYVEGIDCSWSLQTIRLGYRRHPTVRSLRTGMRCQQSVRKWYSTIFCKTISEYISETGSAISRKDRIRDDSRHQRSSYHSLHTHSPDVWALVNLFIDVYHWLWNCILRVRDSCLDHIIVEVKVTTNSPFNPCYVQHRSIGRSYNVRPFSLGRCDQKWPTNGSTEYNTQGSDKLLNQ